MPTVEWPDILNDLPERSNDISMIDRKSSAMMDAFGGLSN